jgi:hypothetical protein
MTPKQLINEFHEAVSHDCKLPEKGYCPVMSKAAELVVKYNQARWEEENVYDGWRTAE